MYEYGVSQDLEIFGAFSTAKSSIGQGRGSGMAAKSHIPIKALPVGEYNLTENGKFLVQARQMQTYVE
jgi:hypothetical protein